MIGKIRGILEWYNDTIDEAFVRDGWGRFYTREQFFRLVYRRLIVGGLIFLLVIWALYKVVAG